MTTPPLFQNRTDYIRHVFAAETPLLRQIRENLTDPHDQISIHPEEGRLLQFLIHLSGAAKIVEIGTLGGYAAGWMAHELPENGHIWTIEKDPRRFDQSQKNLAAVSSQVTVCHGDALRILSTIEGHGPFDLVFIDADKLHYSDYLDWAEQHIRKGGLIVADNTLLFDAVWQQELPAHVRPTAREVMRNFNARLADPEKYTGILLPTAEGMTIAVKNF